MKQHITLSIEAEVLEQVRSSIGRGNLSKTVENIFRQYMVDEPEVLTAEKLKREIIIQKAKLADLVAKEEQLKKSSEAEKIKEAKKILEESLIGDL